MSEWASANTSGGYEGCNDPAVLPNLNQPREEGERMWAVHHEDWHDTDGLLSPDGDWYCFESPDDMAMLVKRLNRPAKAAEGEKWRKALELALTIFGKDASDTYFLYDNGVDPDVVGKAIAAALNPQEGRA